MNILYTVPWDQAQGGVTHVATSLARSLERAGHRALFVFPGESWRARMGTSRRGFPAVQCRLRAYPLRRSGARARVSWLSTVLTSLPQLVRLGRKHRIDLINVHYPTAHFALLGDLARRLRIPLVVSAHGSDLLPDMGLSPDDGVHRLLDHASAVVTPSRTYLEAVVEACPSVGEKAMFIYNGYDSNELDVGDVPTASRSGPTAVLCIAAHVHKKGIDVLLRAVHELPEGELSLRLVGDGILRRQLEDLCESLHLTDRVSFVGSTDRRGIVQELRRADLLVMPSRHASESFGLAVLEAMACGKPVIASAIGGLRELVDPEVTGLSVPPDDSHALALALTRLCRNPALRARLGNAAQVRARRFTVESTAESYERLFKRVVERHK